MAETPSLDRARLILSDVTALLKYHPAHQDPKSGRPPGPGYGHLLRSGISLCYTAWEVYVEEALIESAQYFVDNCGPNDLPKKLRQWIANQQPNPWDFVGDGWQDQVLGLVRLIVEGDGIGKFGLNTASVGNVDSLYFDVIEYSPIQDVKWRKQSNSTVKSKVAALVRLRGEIVHKGRTPESLTLAKVRNQATFIDRLCANFDERLVAFRSGT